MCRKQILYDNMTQNLKNLRDCDEKVRNALLRLINAMPPYEKMGQMADMVKKSMSVLGEIYLPNKKIEPEPSAPLSVICYDGNYAGYQNAFFGGVQMDDTARAVFQAVFQETGECDETFWGNCGVSMLTDAIVKELGIAVDASRLKADLENNTKKLQPALSAAYQEIYRTVYAPTKLIFDEIKADGIMEECCTQLRVSMLMGDFKANINLVMSQGGEQAAAATWFLYNMWMNFKAMGCEIIDAIIFHCGEVDVGMMVPKSISAQKWWTGGYTCWFGELDGQILREDGHERIVDTMPETVVFLPPPCIPVSQKVENGYAKSFCLWGELSWYK